jgi:hypothetical protein
MEENQGPSNYELANSLPPIDSMDREAAQREIARMNSDQEGPLWSEFHLDHKAAVSRLQRLLDHVRITPEEKAARTQEAKKKLDEESDRLWAAYEKQKAEEEIQRGQDKLRERLAAEGKSVDSEEAGKIISNAQDVFLELEKQGIVDPTFRDFLEEVGEDGQEAEGDRLETIQAFHTLSGLLTRFRSWSEKKGKGQK